VHSDDVSIDDGLRSVGWVRPDGTSADTIAGSVQIRTAPPPSTNGNGTICQYCGSPLERGSSICTFCTGENQKAAGVKLQIEPAWQRQAGETEGRLIASQPARDPLLMAFLSGCCLCGLGQILIGQSIKGIVFLLITALFGFVTGGVSSLFIMPIAALDAYLVAEKLRSGKTVGLWEFF
jgi:TM2 domain-containing membrane protein YozV